MISLLMSHVTFRGYAEVLAKSKALSSKHFCNYVRFNSEVLLLLFSTNPDIVKKRKVKHTTIS